MKVEPIKRRRREIVVASGSKVEGKVLDRLDIGVDARTYNRTKGEWRQHKKQAFLTITDANVAEGIHSNVIAEAHFMMENPNFTLITRGSEKYLVWGKPNISFDPIDGQPPVRIDLRYHNHAHYLDIHTAMLIRDLVKPRKTKQKEDQAQDVASANTPGASGSAKSVRLNMMTTEDAHPERMEISTDTDDLYVYTEDAECSAHHEPATANSQESVCNSIQAPVEPPMRNVDEQIKHIQILMENADTPNETRMRAIENLQDMLDKLSRWGQYYQRAQEEIVRVNELRGEELQTQPRRSARQQARAAKGGNNVISALKRDKQRAEDEPYREYDNIHNAHQQLQRRVRFEATPIEAPAQANVKSVERKQRYDSQAKPVSQKKHTPADDGVKSKKDERSEKAVAEAKRRGVNTTDEETPTEKYGVFEKPEYMEESKDGIQVYRDDKYTNSTRIEDASDYTLATFLMENKVSL